VAMKPPKSLSDHLKALGKKGGTARAKRLTAAQRSASAKQAAKARWAKKKP
jgi:hypothetical protein